MRLAHLFNTLSQFSVALAKHYQRFGVEGFIKFVRDTISAPWLDPKKTTDRINQPFQLRLE
jgi:hypothetical protein